MATGVRWVTLTVPARGRRVVSGPAVPWEGLQWPSQTASPAGEGWRQPATQLWPLSSGSTVQYKATQRARNTGLSTHNTDTVGITSLSGLQIAFGVSLYRGHEWPRTTQSHRDEPLQTNKAQHNKKSITLKHTVLKPLVCLMSIFPYILLYKITCLF